MPDKDKAPSIGVLRNHAAVFLWVDTPQVGGPSVVPGFIPQGHCWCSLKPRGDQLFLGAQLNDAPLPATRGSHIVRTRFREDLTIHHMFELKAHGTTNRYRVVAVRNDDARRFTECEVEELGDRTVIATPPALPRGLDEMEGLGHAD